MRTVSACAWAKRQSRLSAAAVAAVLLSSVLRVVFIDLLPESQALLAADFCCFLCAQYLDNRVESQRVVRPRAAFLSRGAKLTHSLCRTQQHGRRFDVSGWRIPLHQRRFSI